MSDTPANVMTNQEQLLQENLELRQSIEALRKYYEELSKFALTIKEAKPTLTAAEREAISEVVDCLTETGTALANATTTRNTLAALLARLA
jgi:hypothetical protein